MWGGSHESLLEEKETRAASRTLHAPLDARLDIYERRIYGEVLGGGLVSVRCERLERDLFGGYPPPLSKNARESCIIPPPEDIQLTWYQLDERVRDRMWERALRIQDKLKRSCATLVERVDRIRQGMTACKVDARRFRRRTVPKWMTYRKQM